MDYSATAAPARTVSFAPSATTWLKLSVVYLMMGVGLGIAMGVDRGLHAEARARAPEPAGLGDDGARGTDLQRVPRGGERAASPGSTSGCTTARCR